MRGIDVNSVNSSGETALQLSLRNGYDRITRFLESQGALYPKNMEQESNIFSSVRQNRDSCKINIRRLENAVDMYNLGRSKKRRIRGKVRFSEIKDRIGLYLDSGKLPVCPDGGVYCFDPKTGAWCSVHGDPDQ
ncbi:MAG: hypothetical protein PHW04_12800 [Candidatus Wallbacteria bacterium]|nr:hypothetical protein [Candidatus Wallbacteria bacterium]